MCYEPAEENKLKLFVKLVYVNTQMIYLKMELPSQINCATICEP